MEIHFPPAAATFTRVGSRVTLVNGVLSTNGRYPLLLKLEQPGTREIGAAVPARPSDSTLRVVNTNLENFFNGNGKGGGFPAARGPETLQDFEFKSARIRRAIDRIKPDIIAVQELENDGFGLGSAAASFIELLNQATEDEWGVVAPLEGRIGSDEITVGLFYRRSRVEPVGPPRVLQAAPFERLSRQPLAQVFRDSLNGTQLLVVSNHFKSKGGCPEDGDDPNANQRDGQACWNPARTEAARALADWLKSWPDDEINGRILIVGDLNAYRMEDPVQLLLNEGFSDLLKARASPNQYTLVYRGQAGTLDYALASEKLLPDVLNTQAWHINAGWPFGEFVEERKAMQYSDHNPVIVDLDFSQSETSD